MIRVYQMPAKAMEETNQFPFMYSKDGLFDLMENIQYYEHVANLDVESLDEAFEVGNIGPEEKYTRFASMRSVSVGDIVPDCRVEFRVRYENSDECRRNPWQ